MRKEMLLGVTKENEILIAEINYRDGCFTVLSHTSYPVYGSYERQVEYFEDSIEYGGWDDRTILDILKAENVPYSELAEHLADSNSYDETFDCSLYSNIHTSDKDGGTDIYFHASGCGQQQVEYEQMKLFIEEKLFTDVLDKWREYHLKNVPFSEVKSLFSKFERFEKEKTIYDRVQELLDSGELEVQ